MNTILTILLVSFVAYGERAKIASAVRRFVPGRKPEAAKSVGRHDAVEAVETLITFADLNRATKVRQCAIEAGKALWDSAETEPRVFSKHDIASMERK